MDHIKRALIGGGSRGIGLASAQLLALNGYSITIMARHIEQLQKAIATLDTSRGQSHQYLSIDVSDLDAFRHTIHQHIDAGNQYSVLINNSGGPAAGPIVSASIEEFISAFNNHLLANHILVNAILPNMRSNQYGRIINIISTSVKQPLPNLGVSNTIRAAVANWSKTLATELAPYGITVNNVLPGATATDRLASIIETKATKTNTTIEHISQEMIQEIPMKRFAQPAEIAAAVKFLASEEASYITGINIPVDGGRTACL